MAPRRPINWRHLRSDEAEWIIRERAAVAANVVFSGHAFERIEEREILHGDVYRILRTGIVEEQPGLNEHGQWQATVVRRMKGGRDAGAVTVIVQENDLLIIRTVMWLDHLR